MKYLGSSKIKTLIFLLLILSVILFLSYLYTSGALNVGKITVSNEKGDNINDITDKLKMFVIDKNIVDINDNAFNTIFTENFREYKFLYSEKKLNKSINVVVKKRKPVLYLKSINGYFLVDDEGFIYDNYNQNGNYYLEVDRSYNIGEYLPDDLQKIKFYNRINSHIIYKQDQLYILLGNGIKMILPIPSTRESADLKIDLLQKLVQQYTINGDGVEMVDLRFSKPVIKYK